MTVKRAPKTSKDVLRVTPLGGIGEIGKNMTVFEFDDEIIVVDCGLAFPEEEMYGIDIVIPDISYLRGKREKVKAFVITHAHEDHVGALPYVLPEFPGVPVYASTLARGLLSNKIKEHKLRNNPLKALEPGETVELGQLRRHGLPHRPLHPRCHGPAHQDAVRRHRAYRRLQVRPDARSTASRPTSRTSPASAKRACSA